MYSAAALPDAAPVFPPERHVLLVVHDACVRHGLAEIFRDAGLRLTQASTFEVADLLLESPCPFDLLVTAQSLPGFGGAALARLTRMLRPGLPVLLLEQGATGGPGVLGAAAELMDRWPAFQRT